MKAQINIDRKTGAIYCPNIIRMYGQDGKLIISAKELHDSLEIEEDLCTWMQGCIIDMQLKKDIDFREIYPTACQSNIMDYAVDVKIAKILVAKYAVNETIAQSIITYFCENEKRYQNFEQQAKSDFSNPQNQQEMMILEIQ